jgi:glutathione-regulated potassium-efflux system ancillary protein KefC
MEDGNLLVALFVLLAATVALVPLAKWAGLGTILGYLAAGVLIGPYGLGLVSDSETIHQIADLGIVMMLFLIGLELRPADVWRMRNQVVGLGLTQMVATTLVLAIVATFIGFSWQAGLVLGLALSMSSTAIAMQSVAARGLTRTDTGRASLSILLVQDLAVIPILALIPVLNVVTGSPVDALAEGAIEAAEEVVSPSGWFVAAVIVGGFVGAVALSRYVIRPIMHFVAATHVREAFTALALLLVTGAALLTTSIGMSAALGAFLGGVLLSDSEYRHELESNLAPFRDLFLGLFFISVGMSIAFSVFTANPLLVIALVLILVGIKTAVVFALTTFGRMALSDRLLVAILLSQAGEFAFVILQFAQSAGRFTNPELELLTAVVALSMATTPILLFLFDRLWAPRLQNAEDPGSLDGPDALAPNESVIVLGYGRFGQIVTRLLRTRGYRMTLIDDDPAQIALVRRFGVKVFYGDGGRVEILRAAGADEARMIVIAVAGAARITAIAEVIRRHFPNVIVAARAVDRSHAHDLMAIGVHVFERETFRAAIRLGERALVALGHAEEDAAKVANAFERHDVKMLIDSYAVRHDQAAYVGFVKQSSEMLEQVMRADIENAEEERRRVAEAARTSAPEVPGEIAPAGTASASADIDNPPATPSDQR